MKHSGFFTNLLRAALLLTAALPAAAKSPAELARRLPEGIDGIFFADCARIGDHPVLGPAVRSAIRKLAGKVPGLAGNPEDAAEAAAAGFASAGQDRPPRICALVALKPGCGIPDRGQYPELPARIAASARNGLDVTLAEEELLFISMYSSEIPVWGEYPELSAPRLLRVIASGESDGAAAAAYLPNPQEVLDVIGGKNGKRISAMIGDVTSLEGYAWIPSGDPSGLALRVRAETPNPMVLAARLRTMLNTAGKVFFARDRKLFTRMMKGIKIGIGNGCAVFEVRWDGEIVSALGRILSSGSMKSGLKGFL